MFLECLNKNDIHDLVQVFDQVKEATIKQEYQFGDECYELHRHITIVGNGTSIIKFTAFRDNKGKLERIQLSQFNQLFKTEFEEIENKPYEVLINIDTGQEFFKDSKKLLNEEMVLINTIAEEVEKTKTRIATSEHYASGDIATSWTPKATTYQPHTINVGTLQDYFVLVPGDRDHQFFQFLQADLKIDKYEESFKFYDYQIIQMAGLSPASFGYEKDSYMNNANVDLSANASEMTIEAIKRQLEPQINRLIENIIRLQQSQDIEENKIPIEVEWDYGANERIDDMKKLDVMQKVQRVGSIPYQVRAKILTPILNKLMEDELDEDDLINAYNEENNTRIEFGEL